VNGSSDLLLQQVRQIEPGSFVNYVDGRSVIQAGRFNSFQNAQIRADELAILGIGAEVQPTGSVMAPIAVTAPADYDLSFPSPVTSPTVTPVPSATVAAAPSAIEFGQAAPFQTPTVPAAPALPPTGAAYPTNVAPPPTSLATSVTAIPSGYYVVIPGNSSDLSALASQVIGLGAPASLVFTRTAPRGPHIAVGPYQDHGIAQEWSNFFRNSGINGARVHFE
jgi:hypothetical protein